MQIRTVIVVYSLADPPLAIDACCISCKRVKSRIDAMEFEDFDAGRLRFLCRDCEEMFADADRLAEEGLRVSEERGGIA
jgi:hypothetical protein